MFPEDEAPASDVEPLWARFSSILSSILSCIVSSVISGEDDVPEVSNKNDQIVYNNG
jgi:hypothetical protein